MSGKRGKVSHLRKVGCSGVKRRHGHRRVSQRAYRKVNTYVIVPSWTAGAEAETLNLALRAAFLAASQDHDADDYCAGVLDGVLGEGQVAHDGTAFEAGGRAAVGRSFFGVALGMSGGEAVGDFGGNLDCCGIGAVGPAAGEEGAAVDGFLGGRLGHLYVAFVPDGGLNTGILGHIGGYRRLGFLYETNFLDRVGLFGTRLHSHGCPDGYGLFLRREFYEHTLDRRRHIHLLQLGSESEHQQYGVDCYCEQDTCVCGFTVVHCVGSVSADMCRAWWSVRLSVDGRARQMLSPLFRCRGQYDLVLIALGNVHEVYYFFYRHCTVGVDREGGVVGVPQQELEGRFYVCEGYGLGISVDVVGVGPELGVVLDGYADGGLGGDLVGALGQQEPEGVGVDQGRGHQEEYQQQEHDVRHGGHRECRLDLGSAFDGHR